MALNKVIDAYRQSLDEAHASEDRMGFAKALEESKDRAEELRSVIADLSLSPLDQALNAASRAANREADKLHLPQESQDRQDLVRARTGEARGTYDVDRSRFGTDRLVELGQCRQDRAEDAPAGVHAARAAQSAEEPPERQ